MIVSCSPKTSSVLGAGVHSTSYKFSLGREAGVLEQGPTTYGKKLSQAMQGVGYSGTVVHQPDPTPGPKAPSPQTQGAQQAGSAQRSAGPTPNL